MSTNKKKLYKNKEVKWTSRHGLIFSEIIAKFNDNKIRYFVLRNYDGLPNINMTKDVDLIIDPKRISEAISILKKVYKEQGITFFYLVKFEQGHNCKGMCLNSKFSIHFDLMAGYFSRGCETYTFDELYKQTIKHKNFFVLNDLYNGIMILIYKQFGYKKPFFSYDYKEIIKLTNKKYPQFKQELIKLFGKKFGTQISNDISLGNFDKILSYSSLFSKKLEFYCFRKAPIKTLIKKSKFYLEKVNRIIINYRKFAKVFSVIGPDGTGKSTFIDSLIKNLQFYYVDGKSDYRFNLYHFRPNIFPNLAMIGENIGLKEQDKDFTNPHRAKPANILSSFLRIIYYWLDYVIGFNILVRKDVWRDRYSIFDRYSYDLIVDPKRIRLNLPLFLRKFFVFMMPHPTIIFFLEADPKIIFQRKKELTLDEITNQNKIYKKLLQSYQNIINIDSNRPIEKSVNEATEIILKKFCESL
tara:strand:- start:4832 stop:6238 length:1407 start_codon:yes stop_codon:yes gene_type:complete